MWVRCSALRFEGAASTQERICIKCYRVLRDSHQEISLCCAAACLTASFWAAERTAASLATSEREQ